MRMQTRKTIAALTLGSVMAMATLTGCGANKTTQEVIEATVPVKAETVAVQNFDKMVTLGGLTQADVTVNIIPMVNGMLEVEKIYVSVGDKVKAGQALAQLDGEASRINYSNAQLAVQNAENSIAVAKQSFENYQTTYNNTLELFELGAVSQSDLDQLKLALDNAETQYNNALLGVTNAKNTLKQAEMALSYVTVTTPVAGTVTTVNADEGGYATASQPMFVVADVDKLEISTGINEQNVKKIVPGQDVLLKVTSVSDQWFNGKIKDVSQVMNPQTKNYPVTITLDNQNEALVPGMYAEIKVVVDRAEDALVIPVQAIVYKEAQPVVYVVQEDNHVKQVPVKLGLNDGDFYVVEDGLNENDVIVVAGNSDLVDGEKVTIVYLDGEEVTLAVLEEEKTEATEEPEDTENAEKTE